MLRTITFLVSLLLPAGLAAQSFGVSLSADAKGDAAVAAEGNVGATVAVSGQTASGVPQPEASIAAAGEEMPDTLSGRLALGLRRWGARDFSGALVAFEAARAMDKKNLTILLFIGGIHFKLNEFDAATQAYTMAVSTAMETDAAVKAKALMGMARIAEARYDLEGAKLAWAAYKTYVSTRPSIPSFVDTAEDRLRAIEQKEALAQKYEVVRQRLAPKQPETEPVTPVPTGAGVS